LIEDRTHLIRPALLTQITADPADSMFLECADTARADYLITGNQRHFPVSWRTPRSSARMNSSASSLRTFFG